MSPIFFWFIDLARRLEEIETRQKQFEQDVLGQQVKSNLQGMMERELKTLGNTFEALHSNVSLEEYQMFPDYIQAAFEKCLSRFDDEINDEGIVLETTEKVLPFVKNHEAALYEQAQSARLKTSRENGASRVRKSYDELAVVVRSFIELSDTPSTQKEIVQTLIAKLEHCIEHFERN